VAVGVFQFDSNVVIASVESCCSIFCAPCRPESYVPYVVSYGPLSRTTATV